MRSDDIRRTFLSFYEERGHTVVPSSPLIPTDPTLMLTVAGMVQFKPYLLGIDQAPYPRATSVQKCFRTENIEDVGNNAKDCTLFEMLGNFSFGDYFRDEACPWAWELLTEHLDIPVDKLWVTVLEGDEETAAVWRDRVGVAPERVLSFPKEDNFWHMGVAGPCGPCTEIYYDRGPAYGPDARPSRDDEPKNHRYQEVYNLVFMQYEQDEPFNVIGELRQTGVDTGMGLERLAQALQDVPTVFDTDLFQPVVQRAAELTGARYDGAPEETKLLQILADHARAITFLVADGVTPSNEGRGYVLRRVLRRALTFARLGGVEAELLRPLAETVIERFQDVYPELQRMRTAVTELAAREEARFNQTLDAGLAILEDAVGSSGRAISGEVAFKLHDTYGFPLDITQDVAADRGLGVDVEGFRALMAEQRERSREVTESDKREAVATAKLDVEPTTFLGYDELAAEGRVVALARGVESVDAAREGDEVDVVLDATPFYAEGGGQVGDRGWITTPAGRAEVLDTQRQGGVVLHRVRVTNGEVALGATAEATVDEPRRAGANRAHTATHVVHHTLRDVLGEHVRQMGSLVEPGRLRFDFSHFSAVDPASLAEIEEIANRRLLSNDAVTWFQTGYRHAVDDLGAMAFFDEKYGETVRVVQIGEYSRELCGGTHVHQTGAIGAVKVLAESSIGSNIRRIEALTGLDGVRWVNDRLATLERAAQLVKTPPDELVAGIERLLAAHKDLQRQVDDQRRSGVDAAAAELAPTARSLSRGKLIVSRRPEDVGTLRGLAVKVRDAIGDGVVVLGRSGDGKANLVAAVSSALRSDGVDARALLEEAAGLIGGGAGGKPDLAMAGGKRADALDEALAAAGRAAEAALG